MKFAYICSPMRGAIVEGRKKAKYYSRLVYKKGYFPITPHLYLEQVTGLYEKNGDREELLKLGIIMLDLCDEIWVFGERISEGMAKEIEYAEEHNIVIKRYPML